MSDAGGSGANSRSPTVSPLRSGHDAPPTYWSVARMVLVGRYPNTNCLLFRREFEPDSMWAASPTVWSAKVTASTRNAPPNITEMPTSSQLSNGTKFRAVREYPHVNRLLLRPRLADDSDWASLQCWEARDVRMVGFPNASGGFDIPNHGEPNDGSHPDRSGGPNQPNKRPNDGSHPDGSRVPNRPSKRQRTRASLTYANDR